MGTSHPWRSAPRYAMLRLLVTLLVVIAPRATDAALSGTILAVTYPYTNAQTPLTISYKTDANVVAGDKLVVALPGWTLGATTTATTVSSCSGTYTLSVANS